MLDGSIIDYFLRPRRRHNPPPAAPRIFIDGPALSYGELLRSCLVHVRADWFGWIAEGGVLRVHQRLGHNSGWLKFESAPAKFVAERAYEHVAERALQIGPGIIHRHRRHFMDRELRATQEVSQLRSVARCDDHVPPGLDHVGDSLH